jgi:hypothetical protein
VAARQAAVCATAHVPNAFYRNSSASSLPGCDCLHGAASAGSADGSKFKAANNRDHNFTKAKIQARMPQIEQSIECYLSMLDTTDRTEPADTFSKTARLQDKITILKEQMQYLKEVECAFKILPMSKYP